MKTFPAPARSMAAVVCLGAGLACCARPGWHWLRQTSCALGARTTWRAWRLRDPRIAPPGAPAFWLEIPGCGIRTIVLHGDDEANLVRAPCLRRLPGKDVILAHRDKHFRRLDRIRVGSRLRLTGRQGEVTDYRVVETEVLSPAAAERRLREQRGAGWLALLTCHPFRYAGPAPDRFIAWARPATGRRTCVPRSMP